MKKTLLCLLMMVLIPFTCQAHEAKGFNPERTLAYLDIITKHFKDKYNVELKNDVFVYVANNITEYKAVLMFSGFFGGNGFGEESFAMSSEKNRIIINNEKLDDKHFFFVLAHEMTHRYQLENLKSLDETKNNLGILEGKADIVANEISSYDIIIKDHGIPYNKLKHVDDYWDMHHKNPEMVDEQLRFYAKQTEGFLP